MHSLQIDTFAISNQIPTLIVRLELKVFQWDIGVESIGAIVMPNVI